jgi:hypothetical protein
MLKEHRLASHPFRNATKVEWTLRAPGMSLSLAKNAFRTHRHHDRWALRGGGCDATGAGRFAGMKRRRQDIRAGNSPVLAPMKSGGSEVEGGYLWQRFRNGMDFRIA